MDRYLRVGQIAEPLFQSPRVQLRFILKEFPLCAKSGFQCGACHHTDLAGNPRPPCQSGSACMSAMATDQRLEAECPPTSFAFLGQSS